MSTPNVVTNASKRVIKDHSQINAKPEDRIKSKNNCLHDMSKEFRDQLSQSHLQNCMCGNYRRRTKHPFVLTLENGILFLTSGFEPGSPRR